MANKRKETSNKQKQAAGKVRRMPYWLQITIILLCGILVSGIILLIAQSTKNSNLKEESDEKGQYTVTFAYQDGTVIDTQIVSSGKGVSPPIPETDDVFRGWSAPINNVTSDIEVHPLFYNIIDDENLFYFNSCYVKEGEEFSINIMLAGAVRISNAELTISYDPEVMEFISATDSEICEVKEVDKGEIVLDLNSQTLILENRELSQITFKALEKDVLSTQVELSVNDAKVIEAAKEMPSTASSINNLIYYLQEVD